MSLVEEFFSSNLEGQDLTDFCTWGFGEDYRKIKTSLQIMNAWNHTNGHLLKLNPDGLLQVDVPKMLFLWRSMPS